jgi:thiol-disulfide isomerase/thioredoxin
MHATKFDMAPALTRRAFVTTAATVVLSGCIVGEGGRRHHALLGKRAPELGATGLINPNGDVVRIGDFAGRTAVIAFFGLWCPKCMADAGNVMLLANWAGSSPNLAFLGVHIGERFGRWGSLDGFFTEKGWHFPVVTDRDESTFASWALRQVPTYLIIDRQGYIQAAHGDLGKKGVKTIARSIADIAARPAA